MKTFIILLILALAMFMGGCSQEEDASQNNDVSATEQHAPSPESSASDQPEDAGGADIPDATASEPADEHGQTAAVEQNQAATVSASVQEQEQQSPDSGDSQPDDSSASATTDAATTPDQGQAETVVDVTVADEEQGEQQTQELRPDEQQATSTAASDQQDQNQDVAAGEEAQTSSAETAAGSEATPASVESEQAASDAEGEQDLIQEEITLTVSLPDETMKSRNYPFTPQVAEDPTRDEEPQAEATFGVAVQETTRPAVPDEARGGQQQPQKPDEAQPLDTAQKAEPASAPAATQADKQETKAQTSNKGQESLGVGFGAPELPEPKPVAQKQPSTAEDTSAQTPEPQKKQAVQQASASKPASKPKLRKAGKKDRVIIKDIPVQPLSPDKPLSPDAPKVAQQFKDFAIYWVNKLSSNYIHGIDNKEVLTEQGQFIARYTHLDKNSLELLVKEKPYDHTPFVGLMKYVEYTYESRGKTPEAALNGNFERTERLGITEIFRYSEGKWIE